MAALKAFIAYSHKDEEIVKRFITHMSVLRRADMIETWHDEKILPGSHWDDEIKDQLSTADIFFPMISSDFIASDYCYGSELAKAEEREAKGLCRIIPIYVRNCFYQPLRLSKNQMLPNGDIPLASLDENQIEKALADIVRKISNTVKEMQKETQRKAKQQTDKILREVTYTHILDTLIANYKGSINCSSLSASTHSIYPYLDIKYIKNAIDYLRDSGYLIARPISPASYVPSDCLLYITEAGRRFLRAIRSK